MENNELVEDISEEKSVGCEIRFEGELVLRRKIEDILPSVVKSL